MIAVGVDTHKEQHLAVALDELGQVLAEIVITTTLAGYSQFVCWLKELGENVLVGIEGAGSYGAGLCEYLQAEGSKYSRSNAHNVASAGPGSLTASTLFWPPRRCSLGKVSRRPEDQGSAWRCKCCWSATDPPSASAHDSITNSKRCWSAHHTHCGNESAQPAMAQRSPIASRGCAHVQPRACKRTPLCRYSATSPTAPGTPRASRGLHPPDRGDGLHPRPEPPGGARCGTYLRRQTPRVQPSPLHQRGSIRARQRHRTTTRIIRQNHPPQTQPRRRPANQRSDLHDRPIPLRPPRPKPRLHAPQNRRRKDQTRGHALAEAIPLPPPLQPAHQNALDNIEASNELGDLQRL